MSLPEEIIITRAEAYKNKNYHEIFQLYSEKSELRQFFYTTDDYVQHVKNNHAGENILLTVNIVSVKKRGKLAEVVFEEEFIQEGSRVKYITNSILRKEAGNWQIFKEKRKIV